MKQFTEYEMENPIFKALRLMPRNSSQTVAGVVVKRLSRRYWLVGGAAMKLRDAMIVL